MISARLAELEQRLGSIDKDIAEARRLWPADDFMIAELNRRRLNIRDEIEELRLRLVVQNWKLPDPPRRRRPMKRKK